MARNPLRPITIVADVALTLSMLATVPFLTLRIIGGLNAQTICVHDPSYGTDGNGLPGIERGPGVSVYVVGVRLCDDSASTAQNLLDLLSHVTGVVFALGSAYLLWRLVRFATTRGAYTPQVVRAMRLLGWWLVVGSVLAPVTVGLAEQALRASMVGDAVWYPPEFPVAMLITGFGLLTFARIMRIGTRMAEDLEGLV
ncbi:DUF2975 domain-containing protein [Thermoactinospora rubra]|uniref:DUF2975 domain-containing protein n=1 Tax=Thermoactinospora rubra TaxID=1088767 RepID=UPI000A112253|nr:DUF2975 domain-containing protein [Thermoactinospora rubra]